MLCPKPQRQALSRWGPILYGANYSHSISLIFADVELWDTHYSERGRIYTCKVCQRMFTKSSSIKHHSLIHTGEKPYKCQICGNDFRLKHHLKGHMLVHVSKLSIWTAIYETGFTQEICGNDFRLKHHLKGHMLVHVSKLSIWKSLPVDSSCWFDTINLG